ncbi:16S rRNA (adenine(1518)-N(6)/adenine(1519)-N(6))-dimethyltransferase RsmA [Desulfurispora thermophila]|uniref:16S rRNA (adenine(1518)-N(6)/adenine(1519)-N(6))- dimethyltransferase RsmA n=1 Tax=Desulfurispora thermophila TaxID=265470 RepID=UPI00036A833F|nr:16S rRNA (adenine(1518)-N(6)/adenine(1519)-N(6))-dimethyltransferase RsmA [Desulfurispora thermophila]
MRDLTAPSRVQALMQKYGLKARKSLGQNFLVDQNIVQKIVDAAGLTPSDTVVEIGPGLGVLTARLAQKAGRVIAVEIDQHLIPVLQENLAAAGNVQLVHGDALHTDFAALTGGVPFTVVANLPYYITTPLLFHLLESGYPIRRLVLMVQDEVADRLAAPPGNKQYGALSVMVQYYTRVEYMFKVPRTVFIPRPGVDSAVVRLEKRETPAVPVPDEALFQRLVRGAFAQRRKTLANALAAALPFLSREQWQQELRALGLPDNVRGEMLSMEQFAALTAAVAGKQ